MARWLAIVVTLLGSAALAADLTPAQRLADFDELVTMVRASYGMLDYKRQVVGADLEPLVETYRRRAEHAEGGTFYDVLAAFLSEFQDAHVGLYRPSTMSARLGFDVTRV